MSVKVSPKYQVVIPEEARRSLHLKPGMEVDVIVKEGIAYLIPVKPISSLRGSLPQSKWTSSERTSIRDKEDKKR